MLKGKEKIEIVWGNVKKYEKNGIYNVLLRNGKEINAVVGRKAMGCLQKICIDDLVHIVILPSPKMPKIIEIVRKFAVAWNAVVVGYMESPDGENWFWFGNWIALNKLETQLFINEIKSNQEAFVTLGSMKGYVFTEPNNKIEIKLYPTSDSV